MQCNATRQVKNAQSMCNNEHMMRIMADAFIGEGLEGVEAMGRFELKRRRTDV
jgi:hypothetical protein